MYVRFDWGQYDPRELTLCDSGRYAGKSDIQGIQYEFTTYEAQIHTGR